MGSGVGQGRRKKCWGNQSAWFHFKPEPIRLVEGGHLNREHRQFSREYSTQRGKLLQTCPAPLKGSEEASVGGAQLLAVGKRVGKVREVTGQRGWQIMHTPWSHCKDYNFPLSHVATLWRVL